MTTKLSRELLRPENGTKEEKFLVMQNRRKALTQVGKGALVKAGYKLGPSLKIPGAHSFLAEFRAKSVRVGIKTSADRWVSIPKDGRGGFGLLSAVDEVFVVTFDQWPVPNSVQIYRFDPNVVTDRAVQVYAEAHKRGHTGLQFLPLDDVSDRRSTTAHFSNLKKDGDLFFEETIEWTDGTTPPPPPTARLADREQSDQPIMDRIKAMLAEHLGVRAELIDIEVRVKV